MSLSSRLLAQFSSQIRSRGANYYSRGAVHIQEISEDEVNATVAGSSEYWVSLRLEGTTLIVRCDCPYYFDQGCCKHIWATLLAAEKKGFLSNLDTRVPLAVLEDDELEGGSLDSAELLDDLNEELSPPRYSPYREPAAGRLRDAARPVKPKPNAWKNQLNALLQPLQYSDWPREVSWPAGREIGYIVDASQSLSQGGLCLEVAVREPKQNGELTKFHTHRIPFSQVGKLPDLADREILPALAGASDPQVWSSYSHHSAALPNRFKLLEPLLSLLFPRICQTGRCYFRSLPQNGDLQLLRWDDGPAWEFWVEVQKPPGSTDFLLTGVLQRAANRLEVAAPHLLVSGGVMFFGDSAARLDDGGSFSWIRQLRHAGTVRVPAGHELELIEALLALPHLPRLRWPPEFQIEEATGLPVPCLKVRKSPRPISYSERLQAQLSFDYEGIVVAQQHPGRGVLHKEKGCFLLRNTAAEQAAAALLTENGFRVAYSFTSPGPGFEIAPRHLPKAVRKLLAAGWRVEAEGKLYRRPGNIQIEVRSGVDWFELHGSVEYGTTTARLPELLAAVKRGDSVVRLDDGSFGMLPEEWLQKYGVLAGLGTAQDDHLRFKPTQAGLLDALLLSLPEASCDALFETVRVRIRSFEGIRPAGEPAGFAGQLRGYQREGLGWICFLREFGFGGCLADDMGLGKTVQVLALLESRRQEQMEAPLALSAMQSQGGYRTLDTPARPAHPAGAGGTGSVTRRSKPSLVVVPRSLVFNWKQEAARFAPQLRVLDHTGVERRCDPGSFNGFDLVLTTYGTLRRDAAFFKDVEFDYVILDEAQAIKNANTASAKSARLLRANHRLVLSGTPVENHLGELWSLFEFLNPGMLGSASVFRLGGAGARNPDEETRRLLARALRPFILRRTKSQVARELPAKLEQTLYCELESEQRRLYNELREHYRNSLLGRIERDGLGKSKIQVLEALLRLRQAACHPGLIDKARSGETSAKLDMLLPQLIEVLEEDHKVLVFSQFTSLLAIVRQRLDSEKIAYLYLDGRTRDRGALVECFQNQPEPKLFLISLKAGGLGLNLTAAEYVFLLDPWWNPAVEAQAIDRTHRIGQTRQVFAYRLIARDTVEEKVLALQQTKRDLADAIIREDNSLISNLSREDLELLLS